MELITTVLTAEQEWTVRVMNDYIKREDAQRALVHTLKDAEIDTACNEQDWYCQGLMDAGVAIDAIPTADVVEVVRCKDCKRHYEHIDPDGDKWNFCDKTNYPVELTDYCSYGERKDGGENE